MVQGSRRYTAPVAECADCMSITGFMSTSTNQECTDLRTLRQNDTRAALG